MWACIFAESPFASDEGDHLQTFRNIARQRLDIPDDDDVSDAAKKMIEGLCKKDPKNRTGCKAQGAEEIKRHKWYTSVRFDWGKLEKMELKAPWKPKVKSVEDASNFGDVEVYEEHLTQLKYNKSRDPKSGWDEHF